MKNEIKTLVKEFVKKHNIQDKEIVIDILSTIQKAQELMGEMFTLEQFNEFIDQYTDATPVSYLKRQFEKVMSQKSWEVTGIWENNKFKITQIIGRIR